MRLILLWCIWFQVGITTVTVDHWNTDVPAVALMDTRPFTFPIGPDILGMGRKYVYAGCPLIPIDSLAIPVTRPLISIESIPVQSRLKIMRDYAQFLERGGFPQYIKWLRKQDEHLANYAQYVYSSQFMSVGMIRRLVRIARQANTEALTELLNESSNPVNIIDWYFLIVKNTRVLSLRRFRLGKQVPDDEIVALTLKTWKSEILERRINVLLRTGYESINCQ